MTSGLLKSKLHVLTSVLPGTIGADFARRAGYLLAYSVS